ncbi:helix-turn-helix domain protein [Clostridium acetireducens DSM 10703]|uniref:Helix-turn-helix domain protein n=1 Tax=Clostridium acetireducens DSM 10703 TaxID=1121290 RepID=A0A1E8EVV5_9CLOT|nr:helix-turn-helix domain-containing protein [Clostridium acetireducens]OFI00005.1 helix-turn-helix domain protein [Clostridium acetireducens DSM 10703]
MEILSIGEKIKRCRIYKGCTLKDVCGSKISVSKMSCIENGKIKPEEWILDHVAKKLEMDVKYLKEDIRQQIEKNVKELKNNDFSKSYEKDLEYNLVFAEENNYYDLAFEILHLMFNYYLNENKLEKNQLTISKYYTLCKNSRNEDNLAIYYLDIGQYFFNIKEYAQASNYYNNVKKFSGDANKKSMLIEATYKEAACYIMLKKYNKAYEIALELKKLLKYVEDNVKKAEIYHMLALLSLRMGKDNFKKYEKESYKLYEDNNFYKSQAMFNYATVMFEISMKDEGINYVKCSLQCFPKDDKHKLVKFMVKNINKLIENSHLDEAGKICEEALDYAIVLDDLKYIEKTYYYKSIIMERKGDLENAEIYMNLALGLLTKFGTKKDIYFRYMELGNIYHKLDNIKESIKYFNLAINLKKYI